jgi:hypothetical protein
MVPLSATQQQLHLAEAMRNTQRSLHIVGTVVEVEQKFIFLKEDDIYIFLDIEPVFDEEDPHLQCAIETDDLAVYKVAHNMLSAVASSLRVRLYVVDDEVFLTKMTPARTRVSNALYGEGRFWDCCGCFCLQDTEDEKYNQQQEWPIDDGFCNFHQVVASGVIFEPKCQKGKDIIAAIRRHSIVPFVEPQKSVIF